LAEGGIMAQYLPLYELSNEDYQTIMRSFAKVFPDALVFFTGFDSILLGGKGALSLHLPVANEKFEIPEVKASLAEVGFTRPEMLLSMFVTRLSDDVSLFSNGQLNTDVRPVIEFSAPRSTFHYTPDENQRTLLDNYAEMPAFLLEGLSEEQKQVVIKSHEAMKMTLQANIFRAKEDYKSNIGLLMKAVELVPDNPVVRNELGSSLMISANSVAAGGYSRQAILQYEMALKYKPNEFLAIYRLISLNMQLQNIEKANEYLSYGLKRFPDSPMLLAISGRIKGTFGDFDSAAIELGRAVEMLPDYLPFWRDLEKVFLAKKDMEGVGRARKEIDRLTK
jgi:tetratricopeptide (TPR) repeat protein